MAVRDATVADAEAVRTVHSASIVGLGPEGYNPQQVAAWANGCESGNYTAAIESNGLDYVVAERDGVVVGFGSLKWEPHDGYEADVNAEVTTV